jgi:hypothetical protein
VKEIAAFKGGKYTLIIFFVSVLIFTLLITDEAQTASGQLRRTFGRLKYYSCSSKDCVVEIKPENMPPVEFIMYGDYDATFFKISFLKPDKHYGRKVKVISYKNRHRGDTEMVKSIRFVD